MANSSVGLCHRSGRQRARPRVASRCGILASGFLSCRIRWRMFSTPRLPAGARCATRGEARALRTGHSGR